MNVCLDRMFVAVLFTSERSDHVRYVDEGDLVELCKWTVDLGSLPTFQQHASSQAAAMGHGFYTEFELGLEVDSAEVRGVLLYNNEVCCTVVNKLHVLIHMVGMGPRYVRLFQLKIFSMSPHSRTLTFGHAETCFTLRRCCILQYTLIVRSAKDRCRFDSEYASHNETATSSLILKASCRRLYHWYEYVDSNETIIVGTNTLKTWDIDHQRTPANLHS